MTLFLAFTIAVLVSMALVPLLMRAAIQFHILDVPNERKLHVAAIPRVGGAAMIMGAVLPIVAWVAPDRQVIGFLLGMGIVFLFGIWDDWKNLHYRWKFLGQLTAILIVVCYGDVLIRYLPLWGDHVLPTYVAVPITVFVLLGITNAINLSDGLDGLAAGVTMMSLGVIAVLAFLAGQSMVLLMCTAVIGGIVGFIRFNTYPARVFMGDGGSQFLGFSVGVLAILLTQTSTSTYSYALPLVILALPILDTVTVFAQRLYEGRSPFQADKNHIHHRLLTLGFNHHEAVFVLYVLQAVLFVIAYMLRYENDALVLICFGIFCAAVWGFLYWAAQADWCWRQPHTLTNTVQGQNQPWHQFRSWIFHGMLIFVSFATAAYLLGGAWIAPAVSSDIALLAVVMLLVLVAAFIRRSGQPLSWVERAVIYITVCMTVYSVQVNLLDRIAGARLYVNLFFIALAVVWVLALRYSKDKKFEPRTLDFLVIFVAVAVPNLPGLKMMDSRVAETIVQSIVLFYGIELILAHRRYFWNATRGIACLSLVFIGLHAVSSMA